MGNIKSLTKLIVQRVFNRFKITTKTVQRLSKPVFSAKQTVPKAKKYVLLEKTEKLPIETYPKDAWYYPDIGKTYSRVRIGKVGDPNYELEITSFYDEYDKIIFQGRKGGGKPNQIRTYEHDIKFTQRDCAVVDATTVRTKEFLGDEETGPFIWKTLSEETRIVRNEYGIEVEGRPSWKHPKRLQIHKVEYADKFDTNEPVTRLTSTVTEFPLNLGVEPKSAKKVIRADIKMDGEIPTIVKLEKTDNVEVMKHDRFLAFRFLPNSMRQIGLTRFFLRQKGLEKLRVGVRVCNSDVAENSGAHFSSFKREIVYKYDTYRTPAEIAAHEVEHAYQHSLIGRLEKGGTLYEQDCYNKFGVIINPKKRVEASKYKRANDIYPVTRGIPDLRKYKPYWSNYLEVKARQAGTKAQKEYQKGADYFASQFKLTLDGSPY